MIDNRAIRHTYFGQIDTPVKAYLLGLLAADGIVGEDRLQLRLVRKDQAAVELLRAELSPDSEFFNARAQIGLSVSSLAMMGHLARYGIVPRKTFGFRWPALVPETLEREFLLGYFDGDGCLTMYARRHFCWKLAGQPAFLEDVVAVVLRHTGIRLGGPKVYPYCGRVGYVWATCAKARVLDAWLHTSGLGFPRKSIAQRERPAGGE